MSHLVILPGNSAKNSAWGELMINHYGKHFATYYAQAYEHWVSGAVNIDFNLEESKLAAYTKTLPKDAELIVLAKSAGSLLALQAIAHGVINPTQVRFFGMPLQLAAAEWGRDDWRLLRELFVPTIAFHNVADPTANYDFTKSILATYAPQIKLITTNETDHWYGDIETYRPYITAVEIPQS